MVAERLRNNNLKIKLRKCEFGKEKIEYLSHVIENGTIAPNPKKVESIANFARPTTIKQVQALLGLSSFYRKFIPKF